MGPPYRDFFFFLLIFYYYYIIHKNCGLELNIKKKCFRNEAKGRRKTFEMELHCRDFVLVMDI